MSVLPPLLPLPSLKFLSFLFFHPIITQNRLSIGLGIPNHSMQIVCFMNPLALGRRNDWVLIRAASQHDLIPCLFFLLSSLSLPQSSSPSSPSTPSPPQNSPIPMRFLAQPPPSQNPKTSPLQILHASYLLHPQTIVAVENFLWGNNDVWLVNEMR